MNHTIQACLARWLMAFLVGSLLNSCAGGGGSGSISGNEGGSSPINEQESVMYHKALNKCYKTGGHRIVKIDGHLRCY